MSNPNTVGLGEYSDEDLQAELASRRDAMSYDNPIKLWESMFGSSTEASGRSQGFVHYTRFIELLSKYTDKIKISEKRNGFYLACGVCGIESPEQVEKLWELCLTNLRSENGN